MSARTVSLVVAAATVCFVASGAHADGPGRR
jgi:hypothetical protein